MEEPIVSEIDLQEFPIMNVNMAAPTRKRGQVEMGFGNAYGHELAFPAGD